MRKLSRKKSKRVLTRQRAKVEKKVREHNRKVKKAARKSGNTGKSKGSRTIKVPDECPFKEAVLKEAEALRAQKQKEREERRLKLKMERKTSSATSAQSLEELVAEAKTKNDAFVASEKNGDVDQEETKETNEYKETRTLAREASRVIESADVILQVLDARDPMGTRSSQLEKNVTNASKKLVLVLNKADLVPKENLKAWLHFLRREHPAIAFKASTQEQRGKLGQRSDRLNDFNNSASNAVGANTLMALLANYGRKKDLNLGITVGVTGYPNVGKSSLINSLKRSRACAVGAKPGVTRRLQEVHLDSKVKLLDAPGIVQDCQNGNEASLRNALSSHKLSDPQSTAHTLLSKCKGHLSYLRILYNLPSCNESDFLVSMAKVLGLLKKGGVPDADKAAVKLIEDWNRGRIKYCTPPPKIADENTFVGEAKVVNELGPEFNLDNIDDITNLAPSEVMHIDHTDDKTNDDEEEDMEDETEKTISSDDKSTNESSKVQLDLEHLSKRKRSRATTNTVDDDDKTDDLGSNKLGLKNAKRARERKEKKERKKRNKIDADLSKSLENALTSLQSS